MYVCYDYIVSIYEVALNAMSFVRFAQFATTKKSYTQT